MALGNTGTSTSAYLAPYAIADQVWSRLYDTFPLSLVSRATGPRGFKVAKTLAASNGVPDQATSDNGSFATNFDPSFEQISVTMPTYRSKVTISNELASDSRVIEFMSRRLAGQIAEAMTVAIIQTIAAKLIDETRYSEYNHFDVGAVGLGGTPKIHDHSGFACLANLSNIHRSRATWVFSPDGFQNFGTQEGRGNLVTLGVRQEDYLYGRLIGEGSAASGEMIMPLQGGGGGGGGGGKGGIGEGELSKTLPLHLRSRLVGRSPSSDSWHTAYLGCPVYTSTGLGVTDNQSTQAWAMLVDLSQFLLFDQPLSVQVDTQSQIANNQTVVHAAYRAAGQLLDPTAGWALVSPG
jgi:hypothetical protein